MGSDESGPRMGDSHSRGFGFDSARRCVSAGELRGGVVRVAGGCGEWHIYKGVDARVCGVWSCGVVGAWCGGLCCIYK